VTKMFARFEGCGPIVYSPTSGHMSMSMVDGWMRVVRRRRVALTQRWLVGVDQVEGLR